jgi:hypothetical protein
MGNNGMGRVHRTSGCTGFGQGASGLWVSAGWTGCIRFMGFGRMDRGKPGVGTAHTKRHGSKEKLKLLMIYKK